MPIPKKKLKEATARAKKQQAANKGRVVKVGSLQYKKLVKQAGYRTR